MASNLALVSINLALVLLILSERTTWRMSPFENRAVFAHFPTLTLPGQFRRLRKGWRAGTSGGGGCCCSDEAVTCI